MTYTGRILNGMVIFDGPARPPEGAVVRVEDASDEPCTIGESLEQLAGQAKGLPDDLAERHDQYRRQRRVS